MLLQTAPRLAQFRNLPKPDDQRVDIAQQRGLLRAAGGDRGAVAAVLETVGIAGLSPSTPTFGRLRGAGPRGFLAGSAGGIRTTTLRTPLPPQEGERARRSRHIPPDLWPPCRTQAGHRGERGARHDARQFGRDPAAHEHKRPRPHPLARAVPMILDDDMMQIQTRPERLRIGLPQPPTRPRQPHHGPAFRQQRLAPGASRPVHGRLDFGVDHREEPVHRLPRDKRRRMPRRGSGRGGGGGGVQAGGLSRSGCGSTIHLATITG